MHRVCGKRPKGDLALRLEAHTSPRPSWAGSSAESFHITASMFPVCFPRSAGFCLWLVLYVHVLASAMANVDSSYCLVCLTRGGVRLRTLSRGRKRLAIFAIVGVVCFAVQLALLTVMVHLGAYRPVANAVAFAVSAQLNFLLSS